MKTVCIAWQDAGPHRKWVPIGRLDADTLRGYYVFRYTRGAEQAHAESGFSPLDAFPVLREVYESGELFPFLVLPGSSWVDFEERLPGWRAVSDE